MEIVGFFVQLQRLSKFVLQYYGALESPYVEGNCSAPGNKRWSECSYKECQCQEAILVEP